MQDETIRTTDEVADLTGVFIYRVNEDLWWWSDDMHRLYGYAPDSVVPTNRLFREHQLPEDRERVQRALASGLRDGKPFSCYHRVQDTLGRQHTVVLVADGRVDDSGTVVALRGFVIDITGPVAEFARDLADDDVARARAGQQDIDLARGILMAHYGVDADVALRILRRQSQHTNRKLRDLAHALTAAAPTAAGEPQHDLWYRISAVLHPGETV